MAKGVAGDFLCNFAASPWTSPFWSMVNQYQQTAARADRCYREGKLGRESKRPLTVLIVVVSGS